MSRPVPEESCIIVTFKLESDVITWHGKVLQLAPQVYVSYAEAPGKWPFPPVDERVRIIKLSATSLVPRHYRLPPLGAHVFTQNGENCVWHGTVVGFSSSSCVIKYDGITGLFAFPPPPHAHVTTLSANFFARTPPLMHNRCDAAPASSSCTGISCCSFACSGLQPAGTERCNSK